MKSNSKLGFFEWETHFKKYEKYRNVKLQILLTERNTGKSYSTWNWCLKYSLKPNKQLLLLRNTDMELEKYIPTVSNFLKQHNMSISRSHIYDNLDFKKGNVIGYIASVNNYIHFKSYIDAKINCVFYEEFNELGNYGKNLYFKFMNLLKTFERFNEIDYLFMLGNKDGFMNDYFINWEILPNEDFLNSTKVTEIKVDDKIVGVCYDYGNNEFKNLKNDETLTGLLSCFDYRTKNYASGGYLQNIDKRVINQKFITPTFKPICNFIYDDYEFVYGYFEKGNALLEKVYFNNELPSYGLTTLSLLNQNAKIGEETDVKEIVIDFINKFRNGKLYLSSYDLKEILFNYFRLYGGIKYVSKNL